jgi:hypothetical protein
MIKKPFLAFIGIVSTLIISLLWFTQSPQFAQVVKSIVARYVPKDLGVTADFSEIHIKFFPPGISLQNPNLHLGHKNFAQFPAGSMVSAEKIDFTFLPFQILSGDIRLHEVSLVNGQVSVVMDPELLKKQKVTHRKSRLEIHWDELFQIRAESVSLQNIQIKLTTRDSDDSLTCLIQKMKFGQWSGKGGLGYQFALDARDLSGSYLQKVGVPPRLKSFNLVHADVTLNALGAQFGSIGFNAGGAEFSLNGAIKGNVLDPKNLTIDSKFKLDANLVQAAAWVPLSGIESKGLKGMASIAGTVKGNLLKPLETLKIESQAYISDFGIQGWHAETLEADGGWEAAPTGGIVKLKKLSLATNSREYTVGKQKVSDGGRIEVGPVQWDLSSTGSSLKAPLEIPVKLQDAHIHWLAAGSLKNIYPLDFRLSGDIEAKVLLPREGKPWDVQLQLATELKNFQLNNQKLGVNRPFHKIFEIPKINLEGDVAIGPSGVMPKDLLFLLPNTQMKLGGKIGFKTGYDLHAAGQFSLDDLGMIAETPVRGMGNSVAIYVKGPAQSVLIDIDLDGKNIQYLGLNLGDAKGRISWDDGPQYLLFKQPELRKGKTHFILDGYLDLGKNRDDAHLSVKVVEGDIHDIIEVFHNLVDDIGWFPRGLNGPVQGTARVEGGLTLDRIQVLADLHGKDWEERGERFKSVALLGGYDRGKYYLQDFHGIKRFGKFSGSVAYDRNQKVSWKLETDSLSVTDLDYIAKLNVPFRGTLKVDTQGEGIGADIRSTTRVELARFKVRGMAMPPSSLLLTSQDRVIQAKALVLGRQAVLDAHYDLSPKEMSSISSEFNHLDFSPILMLLNTRSVQDQKLAGYFSGNLNLKFHSGKVEKSNGSFALNDYYLARSDAEFKLAHPVGSQVTDGTFKIRDLAIQSKGKEATLDLDGDGGLLKGSIRGQLDNSLVLFFTPAIVQASGGSKLELTIGGQLKSPSLWGRISTLGSSLRLAALESQVENVRGEVIIKGSILTVKDLRADLGGGPAVANGGIILYSDRYPELDLTCKVNGSKLKIYPFQFVRIDGNLTVRGLKPPYLVDGEIKTNSALLKEKFMSSKERGGELKSIQYAPTQLSQANLGFSRFKLNIAVEALKGVLVQNDLFRDVEVKGNLKIVNTLEAPGIMGSGDVIQGKLLFKDHVFQITSAGVKFDNPNTFDPSFDLNANTEINGIKIQIYATGRLDKIKVEFTSAPTMPESEILTLLAVGMTSNDAKKFNATDLTALQQGEAASLVLHSLNFNRDLEDKTGFQLQVDQSVNPQQGISAFKPQAQMDSVAAPQLKLRRHLGDRLDLSVGSTVGIGTSVSSQFNLDFMVTQDLSISGVSNNYGAYGTAESQGNQIQTQTQTSQGVDLKFQKRFK